MCGSIYLNLFELLFFNREEVQGVTQLEISKVDTYQTREVASQNTNKLVSSLELKVAMILVWSLSYMMML